MRRPLKHEHQMPSSRAHSLTSHRVVPRFRTLGDERALLGTTDESQTMIDPLRSLRTCNGATRLDLGKTVFVRIETLSFRSHLLVLLGDL